MKPIGKTRALRLALLIPFIPMLAGSPTWKYADYDTRDVRLGTCGLGPGCVRKVWRECTCDNCQTHPTDDEGKAGCDCTDRPDTPTQVKVYRGTCLTIAQPCPSSPCPPAYVCTFHSTPSGAIEPKPQCSLGQGS